MVAKKHIIRPSMAAVVSFRNPAPIRPQVSNHLHDYPVRPPKQMYILSKHRVLSLLLMSCQLLSSLKGKVSKLMRSWIVAALSRFCMTPSQTLWVYRETYLRVRLQLSTEIEMSRARRYRSPSARLTAKRSLQLRMESPSSTRTCLGVRLIPQYLRVIGPT